MRLLMPVILVPVFAVLCALCVQARAEPAAIPVATAVSTPASDESPQARVALAVNAPLGWVIGSFGVSAYLRLGEQLAVRANVATNRNGGAPLGEIFAGFSGEDGTGYGGTVTDVGIAGVWYPRRAWDGFLLEVGVLRRDRDIYVWPEFESKTFTRSTEYAGRALVGWSWLFRQHLFIAIAAGLSAGRESGRDTSMPDVRPTTTITTAVHRQRTDGEGYVRIGWAFGR
jgi:hypothetical protein